MNASIHYNIEKTSLNFFKVYNIQFIFHMYTSIYSDGRSAREVDTRGVSVD